MNFVPFQEENEWEGEVWTTWLQVWKTSEGLFAWADDSGCSCYAPFETLDESDLEKGTWAQAIASLQSTLGEKPRPEVAADVADAIQAILNAR